MPSPARLRVNGAITTRFDSSRAPTARGSNRLAMEEGAFRSWSWRKILEDLLTWTATTRGELRGFPFSARGGGPPSAGGAVDLVRRRLRERLEHQQVDVDVRRPGRRPGDRVGDVLGRERRVDAGVHPVRRLPVAAETHQRELLGADHARRDLGHPHRTSVELEAQGLDYRGGRVLRG